MSFYTFDKDNLKRIATAQDEASGSVAVSMPTQKVFGEGGESNKAKEDEKKGPKRETLAEHLQHCKAKPGNCPFEKAYREIDEFDPDDDKVTKAQAYDRLAIAMTQMFALASDIAKTAIDEDTDAAKNVSAAIETGLKQIQEFCEQKGCKVELDLNGGKYTIVPPKNEK